MEPAGINSGLGFTLITPEDTGTSWRQEMEVVFILKGGGWLRLGDDETIYTLRPRDIFVINRYQLRSLTLSANGAALAASVAPALLAGLCPEQQSTAIECKSFLYPEDEQAVFDIIRRDLAHSFTTFYKNENHLPVMLRSRAGVLVADLIQHFSAPEASAHAPSTSGRERLRLATDYIHRHYKEDITLSALAAHTYLSSSYLSHLFQKQLGQTFTAYVADVRLGHAVALLHGSQTVTEIALAAGFASPGAFIETFKQRYGVTPGQYRKQAEAEHPSEPGDLAPGFSDAFNTLVEYVQQTPAVQSPVGQSNAESHEVKINLAQPLRTLSHTWRRLANAGYAKDLHTPAVRAQLAQMQEEIGFEYIRCKGVLDDDMMLYVSSWNSKKITYNFVYLDESIDFILSLGAKPWLELNHVPALLARNTWKVYNRSTILSLPRSVDEWLELIGALLRHLLGRYGEHALAGWVFMPYFSPSYHALGMFTLEEYWRVYSETVRLVRRILPGTRIAGVNNGLDDITLNRWFLERCLGENVLPDILSLQCYNSVDPNIEETGLKLMAEDEAFPVAVSGDEKYLSNHLRRLKKLLLQLKLDGLPIALAEWSSNIWQRDLCNDTSYKSAYLFKNILENYDGLYCMGYWSVSDQMEEIPPSALLFHGGFGLFTRTGLPKAAYRALWLLRQMGGTLVQDGDGYFVTTSTNSVQVYLYNYAHFDTLYRYRHTPHLTLTDRYGVFNTRSARQYCVRLGNLPKAQYHIRRYSVGPDGGNAYDAWVKLGAPPPTAEDTAFLERQSYPRFWHRCEELESGYTVAALLQPHEVQLITLTKAE